MGFLRNQTASSIAAFLLSPLLVGLTTWLLMAVQHTVPVLSGTYVRPYSICYLIPIGIVTILGGRFPGYFSLALAVITLDYYLIAPNHNIFSAQRAPELAEVFFLVLTGALMTIGLDALRFSASLRVEAEEAAARMTIIMDTTPIGVLLTDLDGMVRYANREADRMLGRSPVRMRLDAVEAGVLMPSLEPSARRRDVGQPAETILTPCLRTGAAIEQREWTHNHDGVRVVIEARATVVRDHVGKPLSGLVVLVDISERRRSERQAQARANREALVNRIGETLRNSLDPDEIQYSAVTALGEALRVDRCYFMTYDYAADYAWSGRDWHREDLGSMSGQYRTSELKLHPNLLYRPGQTLVVDNVSSGFFPDILVADFSRQKIRSLIGVPIYEDGQLAASLVVAMADGPRIWTPEEILLTEAVASQVRSAVAVARLLIQERSRRRNEEVISRISQTLRYSTDPEIIRARSFSVIGNALKLDYCFAISIDDAENFTIVDDWRREGLPSVAGRKKVDDVPLRMDSLFAGGPTIIVDDATKSLWAGDTALAMAALGIRSMVATPMFDGDRLLGLLVAAMAGATRLWTGDEVRLLENAAAQTRLTLEAARVRQREHTVAEALQSALQPPPPSDIPVFSIDYYYQAALDEASVGGDFYDVFAIDANRYAIVIGDVSGKGIAAAAQIASVRNMLRYSVMHEERLDLGITKLNQTLFGDSQLTGFATLFVGVYDVPASTLTFVSCGHEPALLRRASDDCVVDELSATGPPLGAFVESEFEQETTPLLAGDTLLLYTDGVSEAGPDRSNLLGTSGIVKMVCERPNGERPAVLIERLVTRVKAYSNNVLRDDVCILAAVIGKPM